MKVYYGKIYLPHINYTVRIRPHKTPPASIRGAGAWVRSDDKFGCTIYLHKNETPSSVAHELVHVLRYICQERMMDFEHEEEHMAYIMQHLMGRVFGYKWAK